MSNGTYVVFSSHSPHGLADQIRVFLQTHSGEKWEPAGGLAQGNGGLGNAWYQAMWKPPIESLHQISTETYNPEKLP